MEPFSTEGRIALGCVLLSGFLAFSEAISVKPYYYKKAKWSFDDAITEGAVGSEWVEQWLPDHIQQREAWLGERGHLAQIFSKQSNGAREKNLSLKCNG